MRELPSPSPSAHDGAPAAIAPTPINARKMPRKMMTRYIKGSLPSQLYLRVRSKPKLQNALQVFSFHISLAHTAPCMIGFASLVLMMFFAFRKAHRPLGFGACER